MMTEEKKPKRKCLRRLIGPQKVMGRKRKEIDRKLFENLCHIQCTVKEMEHILCCEYHTIDRWCKRTYLDTYSNVYKRFAEGGKASLRRNQFNLSKSNSSMAIWLGKQMLGQKDETAVKHTVINSQDQITQKDPNVIEAQVEEIKEDE
jgi:hypothetical protein